jgi:hypothetical protein
MANIDPKTLSFARQFNPELDTMYIIADKGRTLVAAFFGTFQGRRLFNIRELYEQYGEWNPGKGISVPAEKRDELLKEIIKYAINVAKVQIGEGDLDPPAAP